jgi:hypothetical protein
MASILYAMVIFARIVSIYEVEPVCDTLFDATCLALSISLVGSRVDIRDLCTSE